VFVRGARSAAHVTGAGSAKAALSIWAVLMRALAMPHA
jgi:hypothetical protein